MQNLKKPVRQTIFPAFFPFCGAHWKTRDPSDSSGPRFRKKQCAAQWFATFSLFQPAYRNRTIKLDFLSVIINSYLIRFNTSSAHQSKARFNQRTSLWNKPKSHSNGPHTENRNNKKNTIMHSQIKTSILLNTIFDIYFDNYIFLLSVSNILSVLCSYGTCRTDRTNSSDGVDGSDGFDRADGIRHLRSGDYRSHSAAACLFWCPQAGK